MKKEYVGGRRTSRGIVPGGTLAYPRDANERSVTVVADFRIPLRLRAGAGVVALMLAAVPAGAQGIPDSFTNLQLLPEDISRRELVGVMRGFTEALGVRCSYCHTVSEALNSPDDDFASDAKAAKEAARVMISMVRSINQEHLGLLAHEHAAEPAADHEHAPGTAEHEHPEPAAEPEHPEEVAEHEHAPGAAEHEHPEPAAEHPEEVAEHEHEEGAAEHSHDASQHLEVGCITCHSGRVRPATLQQELIWALDEGGFDALKTRYAQLREQYFGRGAYDFGAGSLESVAQTLARDDSESALAVIELNLEHHPESVQSWLLKGQIHAFDGATQAAIQAYERALELAPDSQPAAEALERLRGGGF